MNKKSLRALALAVLLSFSTPTISKATTFAQERKMETSFEDVNYPQRIYDEKVKQLRDEFIRLKQIDMTSMGINSDSTYNLDKYDLDIFYNVISIINLRIPFDGLSLEEREREALLTYQCLAETGILAAKYATDKIKFSTYLLDSRDYETLLAVEKIREDFNKINYTEYDLKTGNVEEFNKVAHAVREFDRNAYLPSVELIGLIALSSLTEIIPSNYVFTDEKFNITIPFEGRARRDIMEDGIMNRVDFYATNETGTLFTQYTIYPKISEIEDYYGGEFTEAELQNLPAPPKVREMGELFKYGVRSDGMEVADLALSALMNRVIVQSIPKEEDLGLGLNKNQEGMDLGLDKKPYTKRLV